MRLRQCPFCGDKRVGIEVVFTDDGVEMGSNIICYNCSSIYCNSEASNGDELIAAWNKRVR